MDIDVSIDSESLNISIENPHRMDLSSVLEQIIGFGMKCGADIKPLNVGKLISQMVRGVAGCEGGCPADAMGFVKSGFRNFSLSYIEGGILSAVSILENGRTLSIKVFPGFD